MKHIAFEKPEASVSSRISSPKSWRDMAYFSIAIYFQAREVREIKELVRICASDASAQ